MNTSHFKFIKRIFNIIFIAKFYPKSFEIFLKLTKIIYQKFGKSYMPASTIFAVVMWVEKQLQELEYYKKIDITTF